MENSENTAPDLAPEPADTGARPVPDPPMDADPPEARTPEGTGARGRPGHPRLLTLVGSGLLVVVLIGVIVWFAVSTSAVARENAIKGTAHDYLTAIADADADGALDKLVERPANTALLTRDVLEASRLAAPLTDIEIAAVDQRDHEATADATYRLGEEQVSARLQLTGDGRTSWKIAVGTAVLSVPEVRGLRVNGVTLTETANPAFPGSYTAKPLTDHVRLDGETTAVIGSPAQEGAVIAVTPTLSDSGRDVVLTAVKTRFDECLAATVSRPVGCPFGLSDEGVEVAPDSVRFTLTNDPWAGFAPSLDPASLIASGSLHYEITATATVTVNGLTGQLSQPFTQDRAFEVDLTQTPAVVVWR